MTLQLSERIVLEDGNGVEWEATYDSGAKCAVCGAQDGPVYQPEPMSILTSERGAYCKPTCYRHVEVYNDEGALRIAAGEDA